MRVVTASPARRSLLRWHSGDGRARIERLGLAAASLVLLLGLALTYAGTRTAVTECAAVAGAAGGTCVIDLSAPPDAAAVQSALPTFGSTGEQRTVARVLVDWLQANGPIEHVGALARLTVPADIVRADPQLVVLNERLRARPDAAVVTVLSAADLAALKPRVIVRTQSDYGRRVLVTTLVFLLSFWAAHLIRAWRGSTGDALLLPIVQLLTGLGLMAMLALRDPLRDTVIAWTMSGGIAAGCAIWVAVSAVDFEDPRFRRAVLAPLAAAVLLALALLVFGSGPSGSGAKVNLFGVQPVELIRPLVVLALAAYFARRWTFLRELSAPLGPSARVRRHLRPPRWKDVRPLAITLGTLLLFFFLQRDLGPALVLSCVFLGLYGAARGRAALVAAGMAAVVAGFATGYLTGYPATVTRRVAMWLDPWENALPGGDQVAQSLWALASGGFWGVGPGFGDPQLVPAGHTDLVLAALGEELGLVGVLVVIALFALLIWRLLRIALRAPGDFTCFLALGLTLSLAVQAIVIVGGLLGLLPLAGVVTPFLSYGRSAMLSNFAAVAVCAAIARRAGATRTPFVAPLNAVRWTLAAAAMVLAARAAVVQVVRDDVVAAQGNLTQQADGGYRFQYNPRLVAASRAIVRGTIYDRTGLPLATSRPELVAAAAEQFQRLQLPDACPNPGTRCYPLGGMAFHLIGDADRQTNWAARNTSFVEQDFDMHLKGFDDQPRIVEVRHPHDGRVITAVRRNYAELLPLVRHRANPGHRDVQAVLNRGRDLHLSIDAGLQAATARALRARAIEAGSGRGAAVVLDPASGAVLASASYPWPEPADTSGPSPIDPERLLDRARYGLYPPGSTFKLVTAVAAMRTGLEDARTPFQCVRLPDGRVGGRVPGVPAPVRDDPSDRSPHGALDLHRALVVSCNAYFAQLAQQIGAASLAQTAAMANIAAAPAPAEANLARTLPHAGYGQGDVLATPLRMARATAALATDGVLRDVRVTRDAPEPSRGVRWLGAQGAARLRRDMRAVVTSGSGRALAGHRVAIAGKTGTAEVDHERSHSWFVGFAPYSGTVPARMAFAVVVEHAGYGGRIAAPLAGDIVTAAQARGLLQK